MRAIVTGGAGFIGSHLVDLLLDEGHEVVVVDSLATGRLENLSHRQGAAGLSFARHDIREPGLESAFAGADWVFHLAALADIVPSVERPEAYFTTNVDGTFRVLEAARAAGAKRFVYAASSSCYGIPDAYPTAETAPPRPQYPYALTKWLGEQTVLHWGQVYRLPVVSLRLFNVYGPRARTGGTYGAVMGVFLAQKLAGKPFTIVGDGTQVRDFVFVQDIARAFLAAARSDVTGEVMNVGTGDPQSVNRLAELLGPAERVALPWRPGEPDRTHADAAKIGRLLGWRPQTTFAEGVKRTLAEIHHWRDAPVWDPASIARATESWFKCLGNNSASEGPASACRGEGVRQANPDGRWPEAGPERAPKMTMIARDPAVKRVMVTGGAGYVGSRLVPALLEDGYEVTVLDLYLYGEGVLPRHPRLREVKGDLRDLATVRSALEGAQAVVHLACISNDPSFELDPSLGRSINLDALAPLVEASRAAGVKRFVYASSSSVYGVKEEEKVSEELSLEPLTDYSKFKAMGEEICLAAARPGFAVTCIRPATVCGYSPRQRLDVIVNLLTGHAFHAGKIKVMGGEQYRPNLHIEDMVDVYRLVLGMPVERVASRVYNVGHLNQTVSELATMVRENVPRPIEVVVEPTNDPRSYRIDSSLIERELGFVARRPVSQAVRELVAAFQRGLLPDAPDHPRYWNVKTMKQRGLT